MLKRLITQNIFFTYTKIFQPNFPQSHRTDSTQKTTTHLIRKIPNEIPFGTIPKEKTFFPSVSNSVHVTSESRTIGWSPKRGNKWSFEFLFGRNLRNAIHETDVCVLVLELNKGSVISIDLYSFAVPEIDRAASGYYENGDIPCGVEIMMKWRRLIVHCFEFVWMFE